MSTRILSAKGLTQRDASLSSGWLQHKGAGGSLQRATDHPSLQSAPPLVREVLGSPGQPLAHDTRAFMESRFQQDFSRVRLHTDQRAAESAREVDAGAFTVGSDVVFAAGRYAPTSVEGKKLLAHELTHVVQQRRQPSGVLAIRAPADSCEQEASIAAAAIHRSGSFGVSPQAAALMRQPAQSKESDAEKEIKAKVKDLVNSHFAGDFKKAFNHYAGKDDRIDKNELDDLLDDAGVGWALRKFAIGPIVEKMDDNKNEKVDWVEFEKRMKALK